MNWTKIAQEEQDPATGPRGGGFTQKLRNKIRAAKHKSSCYYHRDNVASFCTCDEEDEPKGKMPTVHATCCEMLRAAIAKAEAVPS